MMNERIKELAKKAGGNPNYKAFFGHFLPPPPDYIDPATVDLEKFAELIVQEMLAITDAHTEVFQTDRDRALIEHIKKSVTQHFDVTE